MGLVTVCEEEKEEERVGEQHSFFHSEDEVESSAYSFRDGCYRSELE
jgi:hypothetical protein